MNNRFDQFFQEQMTLDDETLVYGQVIVDYGSQYKVLTDKQSTVTAQISGKFRNTSDEKVVIGDWVEMTLYNNNQEGLIQRILTRKTEFARKAAGNTAEKQVQGANFDTVFIVMALNNDFNLRKLERFVLAAWDTGGTPVVILTKTDLCDDTADKLSKAFEVAPGVDIYAISALDGVGIEQLKKYLAPGKTIALFGASGVGKSTLINTLAGKDMMKVNKVRSGDDRGTHTTTHREMIPIGDDVMLMDTPGMRELGLWDDGTGVDQTFSDITELATLCRFSDCQHGNEPGCRIQEALASGQLDESRHASYLKLKKEAAFIKRKSDQNLQLKERKKWKDISKFAKSIKKSRY